MADDLNPIRWRGRVGPPLVEQIIHHRIELFVRRIPGFEQVVVERHPVDGVDRGLGVGVGGQKHPLGLGRDRDRLLEKLDSGHHRHPLVGEQHRDRRAAQLRLPQRLQRLLTTLGAQHPVVTPVAAPEIALDGSRDGRLVVDRQHHRPGGLTRLGDRGVAHPAENAISST